MKFKQKPISLITEIRKGIEIILFSLDIKNDKKKHIS